MLNELQQRVARLMSGLPAADDFALAGGAALIVYGLVDRSTPDLDYVATGSDAVAGGGARAGDGAAARRTPGRPTS